MHFFTCADSPSVCIVDGPINQCDAVLAGSQCTELSNGQGVCACLPGFVLTVEGVCVSREQFCYNNRHVGEYLHGLAKASEFRHYHIGVMNYGICIVAWIAQPTYR